MSHSPSRSSSWHSSHNHDAHGYTQPAGWNQWNETTYQHCSPPLTDSRQSRSPQPRGISPLCMRGHSPFRAHSPGTRERMDRILNQRPSSRSPIAERQMQRPISPRNGHAMSPVMQHPSSPHGDMRGMSPRHEMPSSPRRDRQTSPRDLQRPHSPRSLRPCSPRGIRHPSPMGQRPQSPRGIRQPSPMNQRPPSPIDQRPPSPRGHRPSSPRGFRPPSPRCYRPSSPRGYRPPSPKIQRPSSPRAHHPPSPRTHCPPSPRTHRPPSPRAQRPPSPRSQRPSTPRDPHVPSLSGPRPPSPRRERVRSPRERLPSPRIVRGQSPRMERLPSPRRERPPSPRHLPPMDWRRQSPPRAPYGPPPPPVWRRNRSPIWARRSPPRYIVPPHAPHPHLIRPRSPPRAPWSHLPHPEWDRAQGLPPPGNDRPPPPWYPGGPACTHGRLWNRRWERPPDFQHGPNIRHQVPPPQRTTPSEIVKSCNVAKSDDGFPNLEDNKEEEIESFDLPEYDADVALGQKYVIAVSGFFCKICHKFYNSENSAKITHCKSKTHYDKFSKWLAEKKLTALTQKRSLTETTSENDVKDSNEEPPNKQIKTECTGNDSVLYDPTHPTESDTPVKNGTGDSVNVKIKSEDANNDQPDEVMDIDEVRQPTTLAKAANAYSSMEKTRHQVLNVSAISDSDTETALITDEVKKDESGFVDATKYNVRKLKVNQLKANLEKRGLKSTGLKTLLLKRLEKVILEEARAAETASETSASESVEDKLENTNNEQPAGVATNNHVEEANDAATGDESASGSNVAELTNKSVDEVSADTTKVVSELSTEPIPIKQYVLKMMESDIESSNRKTMWISEEELKQNVLEIDGVVKVNTTSAKSSKVGRKKVVEWLIEVDYRGYVLPSSGLRFSLATHQQLAFELVATTEDDEN